MPSPFDRSLSRRAFLGASAAVALVACSGGKGSTGAPTVTSTGPLPPVPALPSDPFTLGVASGCPGPDGFVLWTRLAPEPMQGGGMPEVRVPVRWMVGADDAMRDVVQEGVFVTGPDVAHTVHAIIGGLDPDRPYWYRFSVGDWETPIARTRTFPAENSSPQQMRFGFASCQNFRDGYYTAWGDVAADGDLDFVAFLGDYIYESGVQGAVRAHDIPEVITLPEYRNRYALYRSDPLLRSAHASVPWIVTWDDHEVDNNYQGNAPESTSAVTDPQAFLARRAAAYKAWWEHMPTRLAPPTGPDFAIYRGYEYGDLARINMLDTRQYRTDQPCSDTDIGALCDAAQEPATTLIGADQERWLAERFSTTPAKWNILAQQIVFSRLAFGTGPGAAYNLDQWDGYPVSRDRVLAMMAGASNPVVITGDIHASGVSDIKRDFDDPASPVVGTEFVGTSISSNGAALGAVIPTALESNPHLKWADASKRGWVRCEVTPDAWRADYRLVEDATKEGAPVTTAKSWVVESGRPVREA